MPVLNDSLLPPLTEAPRPETPPSGWLPSSTLGTLLETITGTGMSQAATLFAFTLTMTGVPFIREASEVSESPRPVVELPVLDPTAAETPVSHARHASGQLSPMTELRERTGLNVVQLAELFAVTRATIYAWERGALPRGERESHVLEALAFVRNAAEQFPDTRALKQWLMTPVAAGTDTPLKLMAQRRWRPLRGFLVQARTSSSQLGRPEPLRGGARPLEPGELRRATRSLSPPPAHEDEESTGQ